MRKVLCVALVLIGVCMATTITNSTDYPPYEFAHFGRTRLWKTVYQGCEIFVATGDAEWDSRPYVPNMVLGRGCK
jgi:hypothetical protein